MRRILNQIAWAAARSRDTHFQKLFRRFVPRMGVQKALWAVAHHLLRVLWKILHHGVRYIEYGPLQLDPTAAHKRKQRLLREFRKLGYSVQLTPLPLGEV